MSFCYLRNRGFENRQPPVKRGSGNLSGTSPDGFPLLQRLNVMGAVELATRVILSSVRLDQTPADIGVERCAADTELGSRAIGAHVFVVRLHSISHID
ncbi:hypothetical protein D3C71_1620740 [compost metagenome]